MAKEGLSIRVAGRVQGVGFRFATKTLADQLGVVGDVANLADGSVHIHAVAESATLAQFVAAVKKSPSPYGRVATYEAEPLTPLPDYDGFQVTG